MFKKLLYKNITPIVISLCLLSTSPPASADVTAYFSYNSGLAPDFTVDPLLNYQTTYGTGSHTVITDAGQTGFAGALVSAPPACSFYSGGSPTLLDTNILNETAGTIEFWLAPNWNGTNQGGQGVGPTAETQFLVGSGNISNTFTGWKIVIYNNMFPNNGGSVFFFWESSDPTYGTQWLPEHYLTDGIPIPTGTENWQANQWHHIAAAWNNTHFNLWVDGISATTPSDITNNQNVQPHPFDGADNLLWIAGWTDDGGATAQKSFDGKIDDLVIWDEVRYSIDSNNWPLPTQPASTEIAKKASSPQPTNLATDIDKDITLDWESGTDAVTHKLYFDSIQTNVTNRSVTPLTISEPASSASPPISLTPDTTYFWAVDEVDSTAQTNSGPLWRFTTKIQSTPSPVGDLNADDIVNLKDLYLFAKQWPDITGSWDSDSADLDNANGVNNKDLAILAANWQRNFAVWKYDIVVYDKPGWNCYTYGYPDLGGVWLKGNSRIIIRFDSADETTINDDFYIEHHREVALESTNNGLTWHEIEPDWQHHIPLELSDGTLIDVVAQRDLQTRQEQQARLNSLGIGHIWRDDCLLGWDLWPESMTQQLIDQGLDVWDSQGGSYPPTQWLPTGIVATLGSTPLIARKLEPSGTWQESEITAFDPSLFSRFGTHFYGSVVLADDTILLPCSGTKKNESIRKTYILRSVNEGTSWQFIQMDPAPPTANETCLVKHPSGRVVALIRGANNDPVSNIYCSVSDDNGLTWTPLQATGMIGQPMNAICLNSGNILCTYAHRLEPAGIRATLSYDQGQTWDTANEKIIREDIYPSYYIGGPASVQLADETILTVYNVVRVDSAKINQQLSPAAILQIQPKGHQFIAASRYTEDYIKPPGK